jgi:hypothetical protein
MGSAETYSSEVCAKAPGSWDRVARKELATYLYC